jgi:hypothetical protein
VTSEHRAAALANQRAAAFVRFQMIGDHEAMSLLLTDLDERGRLAFIAALTSIAATLSTRMMGEEQAVDYFQLMASTSAFVALQGE